jgi:uncharacterized protein (DUF2249 family)
MRIDSRHATCTALMALLVSACQQGSVLTTGEETAEQKDALARRGDGRQRHPRGERGPTRRPVNVQLGPRPYYLVEDMDPGPLKRELERRSEGPFEVSDFSIGHRGACLHFPEHTKESYEAAARSGASAVCCTSDITLAEFKTLCGKMDGAALLLRQFGVADALELGMAFSLLRRSKEVALVVLGFSLLGVFQTGRSAQPIAKPTDAAPAV